MLRRSPVAFSALRRGCAGAVPHWAILRPTLSAKSGSIRSMPASVALTTAGRWQSSCPFSSPSATADGTTTTTEGLATSTSTCPIMGTPVAMACPVEEAREPSAVAILSSLGKAKLSMFVTATATVGYVLAGGTSPLIAAVLTAGTFLQSVSACSANQIVEMKYDMLMKRTCKRPLLCGQISRPAAIAACSAELVAGTALLAAVSPAAAGLGALNWFLYVCMYTPLKRVSATNTWFGAIVGGIPPLMGGVCGAGTLALTPASGPAYLLGAFMLAWQIPHFMALSFHCRRDYESAGFKMLAFTNPWRASVWAVVLSLAMAVITIAGPAAIAWPAELWYYPVTIVANAVMIFKSVRFHQDPVRYCRSCFVYSYLYLAVILAALALNHVQPVATSVAAAEAAVRWWAVEEEAISASAAAVVTSVSCETVNKETETA